jgi:hypothetical protein
MSHPIQPIVVDQDGVPRFQGNAIVQYLLAFARNHGCGLNELAEIPGFRPDDWQQLAQLLGYSLDGYGELSYVTADAYEQARLMATAGLTETQAHITHLEREICALRDALREPIARLYGIHPDDLCP